jgi:hypothetical protein
MKRYWFALAVAMFFYAKTDILIWQRIFEAQELTGFGNAGTYQWGWFQSLFGFVILGTLVCFPNIRRMILFPISLTILAFSGSEDILYYLLDGKPVPHFLPWLNKNFLLIRPVTAHSLYVSAAFWVLMVLLLYVAGAFLERLVKRSSIKIRETKQLSTGETLQ